MSGPDATSADLVSDIGLPMSARQEQFSLGYVQLIAASAGCWIKTHAVDYDGVDITVASSAEYTMHYGPQFELQLKCTTQHARLAADHLAWPMSARPLKKLTNPKRYIPAYLGVLLVPSDVHDWLDIDDDRLLTRSTLYYESAAHLAVPPDGQDSKTVRLPRSNLFDVAALERIMASIGEGGEW